MGSQINIQTINYKKSIGGVTPVAFIVFLGLGIVPIITGSQLNQAVQNANEAYQLREQTQYYADNKIPPYDIDKRVGVEGIELYNNINQDKYGKVEWIEAAKGELLITLKDNTPLYEIGVIADKYNLDILERYRTKRPAFRLRLASIQESTGNSLEMISNYTTQQSSGELENIWRELDIDQRLSTVDLNSIINTNQYGQEWGGGWWPIDPNMNNPRPGDKGELQIIDAHRAWKELKDFGMNAGGDHDVWIAVIDDGVDLDHIDLNDNIAKDFGLVSSDNPNGWVGKYFGDAECEEGKYKEACNDWIEFGGTSGGLKDEEIILGHGTFVSGIALEEGGNIFFAAGVAFGTSVVPINASISLEKEIGYSTSSIVESIDYAVSLDKVRIINMSFGNYSLNTSQKQAIDDAFDAGKILVAAAGNGGSDNPHYPSSFKNVISVAAVDNETGQKNPFTDYGKWVDTSALIDFIYSTKYSPDYNIGNFDEDALYGTDYLGGTSWGAPQVAGSIALLISRYPNLSRDDIIDITLQRPHTFYYGNDFPTLGCGVVNPGDMLTSKAPLIEWNSVKVAQYGPQCIRRFWLGEDIQLDWRPFPVGTGPASYRVHYQRYEASGFIPPKSTEGTDIGNITSWTVKSDEAEMLQDGTWVWFLGAWYPGENKLYWTSPQTIFKHTGANISTPKDNKVVGPNEKFDWEDIANANKYVGLLQCDGIPLNPDPRSTKWAWGYLFDMGDKSERFLSDEEWKELKEYANQLPEGRNYMECSWSVAGTRITDQDLWWGLDLNKDAHFKVPRD